MKDSRDLGAWAFSVFLYPKKVRRPDKLLPDITVYKSSVMALMTCVGIMKYRPSSHRLVLIEGEIKHLQSMFELLRRALGLAQKTLFWEAN